MSEIAKLQALEILDSRGNPTLSVTVTLANGVTATAKVAEQALARARKVKEEGNSAVQLAVERLNRIEGFMEVRLDCREVRVSRQLPGEISPRVHCIPGVPCRMKL
jgi:hypothetical protein